MLDLSFILLKEGELISLLLFALSLFSKLVIVLSINVFLLVYLGLLKLWFLWPSFFFFFIENMDAFTDATDDWFAVLLDIF